MLRRGPRTQSRRPDEVPALAGECARALAAVTLRGDARFATTVAVKRVTGACRGRYTAVSGECGRCPRASRIASEEALHAESSQACPLRQAPIPGALESRPDLLVVARREMGLAAPRACDPARTRNSLREPALG